MNINNHYKKKKKTYSYSGTSLSTTRSGSALLRSDCVVRGSCLKKKINKKNNGLCGSHRSDIEIRHEKGVYYIFASKRCKLIILHLILLIIMLPVLAFLGSFVALSDSRSILFTRSFVAHVLSRHPIWILVIL